MKLEDTEPAGLTYPFVPKSNRQLAAGHYWSLPLLDGRFGCGRVIGINREARHGAKVNLVAGIMNWLESEPPTDVSIQSTTGLVDLGVMHVKNFQRLDTPIPGWAAVGEITVPELWIDGWIVRGAEKVREQRCSSATPSLSPWSVGLIWMLANAHLLKLSFAEQETEFQSRFLN